MVLVTLPVLIPAPSPTMATATDCFLLAVDTLMDLPTEQSALVGLFTDLGIRGVPSSGLRCVLAEYLQGVVDPAPGIALQMLASAMHVGFEEIELIFNLPRHLQNFAHAFDDGEYPELCRDAW